ncbi:hypothetical protein MMC07_001302 [Pseudocyphellaria aurata]|nr:hypothetical protein [Pseudocyphellaria aurata]
MSGNPTNDSAGGPASPERQNGKYEKAILKGEITVTKLNMDNYPSWAELDIDGTMLWRLRNHPKGLTTSQAMWDVLRRVHGAQGQGRLDFLMRKFFNYKAGASESIDEILSGLSRLQLIIRAIEETEAPTDLDVAFIPISFMGNDAYIVAKYHLEDMHEITLFTPTSKTC